MQYILHYVGKYEYNYMDDVYNNDVVCTYDNSYGWYIAYAPKGSYHDWSKMYGTWYAENTVGEYKYTIKIVIKDVNDSTGKIKFDVRVTDSRGFGRSRNKKEVTHKDVNMDIDYNINIYSFERKAGAEYLIDFFPCYTDIYDVKRIWEDGIQLIWGKDVGMKHCYIDWWDNDYHVLTQIEK